LLRHTIEKIANELCAGAILIEIANGRGGETMDGDYEDGMERRISRRRVLEAGACALGAALLGAAAASAQEAATQDPAKPAPKKDPLIPKKASQKNVAYRDGAGWRKCSTCRHWETPDQCRVVEGPIKPDGRCDLYIRRWAKPGEVI
jgi:hypothetical protein